MRPRYLRLSAFCIAFVLLFSLLAPLAPARTAPAPAQFAAPGDAVAAFWAAINDHQVVRVSEVGVPGGNLQDAAAIAFADVLADERAKVSAATYRVDVAGDRATVWSYVAAWGWSYRFELVKLPAGWFIDRFSHELPYVIEHARADLAIDPAGKTIRGKVTLELRPDMDGLTDVTLYLFPTLAVSAVRVNGSEVAVRRQARSWNLEVPLPSLGDGQSATIEFEYAGPVHDKDRYTARVWNDIGPDGAYLATALGWDAARTADVFITVPAGQTAAAPGELVETLPADGGRTTYHFRQDIPATALAVNRYQPADAVIDGVAVHWDLLPEHAGQSAQILDLTRQVLTFFSERFGPFPFQRLRISEIPPAMGGGVTVPEGIMLVPHVTPGLSHSTYWPELVAHEISHQWWGTTVKDIHPWGWEAFASYAADAFIAQSEGEARFQQLIKQHRDAYLKAARLGDVAILAARDRYQDRAYFQIVYDKGALVLHMLRYQIGDDAFWRTLREFAQRYAGKEATPWDFERVAEEVSGQDLRTFFFQWLSTTNRLDLSVEHYGTKLSGNGYLTTFTIVNRGNAVVPFVDVLLDGLSRPVTVRVNLTGRETTVSLPTDEAPRRVILDPDHWLLDVNTRNNIAGVGPFDRGSPIRAALIALTLGLLLAALAFSARNYVRRVGWAHVRAAIRAALALDDMDAYVKQHGVDFDPTKVRPELDYSGLPAAERAAIERTDLWHDGIRSILATDVGSTTTKALLWVKGEDGEFRLRGRTEAPTTVEAPWEDVTLGLTSAVEKLEAATGLRILADGEIVTPPRDGVGVDLYISTSSAGGGLQMVVAGVMKKMTADSADRAAQAAGGIVTDVLSIDDGRLLIERIQRLRELRPDIILLSGGIDGGDISHVVSLAEQVAIAEPRTRLGGLKTPLVYAGNAAARPHVLRLLADKVSLHIVDNIRPVLEQENIEPARQMIHQLFMEHVMSQAPGYPRLLAWSRNALLPTPGAVGRAIQAFGDKYGINVAAFDIGGATTDVFSLVGGRFHRTVSANLGMSYSATNVLAEATPANVLRWLPFACTAEEIEDWAANKMIRPTSLPQTLSDLIIEQALAREALRLAFEHHRSAIDGLKGVQRRRDMAEILDQLGAQSAIDLLTMDALIGSGGVLSHAPRREQALMMLIDALLPEGVTELFVDSIFMSPQLGLLTTIRPQVATEILERDGLCLLGTCIAPVGRPARSGRTLAHVVYSHGARRRSARVVAGQIARLPLEPGIPYQVTVYPRRGYDCGAGPGRPVETFVEAGLFGLILDGRGRRPLVIPADPAQRIAALRAWLRALSVYDEAALADLDGGPSGR